ncbi:endonuclease/exonuclease/phosphatase family protein [Yoonia sp. SS1-5]|uniref:Endonuclease/exonuclease/phosphatase family protein n=1 Tax=Yoonia rhodophyticola TaxID=3137370 RepID=A0AAN0MDY4_9RHOB
MRDIQKGEDPQIAAIIAAIDMVAPDLLVLTDFDYDLDGIALAAFSAALASPFPYQFARRPNTGMASGLDLDGNGWLGEARDAQGYGRFAGDGGMAILSRFSIDRYAVVDLSGLLWRDMPGASLPDGFFSAQVLDAHRLSTSGHWIVPVQPPDKAPFHVLAFAATPPVFDGPEDRNGLRNRDELRLWTHVLDGHFGPAPAHFVLAGNANLDPQDGAGFSQAMAEFLADPRLQDPLPGIHTADWPDDGPGNLRVSYVLPDAEWQVHDAGVHWPAGQPGSTDSDSLVAGPHHLVWVDISR